MSSITIHKLDRELAGQLKARARAEGVSLNQLIKRLLEDALGMRKRRQKHRGDFEGFLGVWSKDERRAFDKNVQEFEPAEWPRAAFVSERTASCCAISWRARPSR